jgi:NADPH-dependent curcumin reductase CurA
VIGIAGSDEKCRWVETLGADVCINYKKDTFKEDLSKATEGFVEVFFGAVYLC